MKAAEDIVSMAVTLPDRATEVLSEPDAEAMTVPDFSPPVEAVMVMVTTTPSADMASVVGMLPGVTEKSADDVDRETSLDIFVALTTKVLDTGAP